MKFSSSGKIISIYLNAYIVYLTSIIDMHVKQLWCWQYGHSGDSTDNDNDNDNDNNGIGINFIMTTIALVYDMLQTLIKQNFITL